MKTYALEKISSMAVFDRPREKIISRGAESLSDIELMAIMIGSGSRQNPVEKIAAGALLLADESTGILEADDFLSIEGIGPAKATLLAASMELSRRIYSPRNRKIKSPSDVYPLLSHYGDRQQEYFFCISLNGAHEVIEVKNVSKGILNRAIFHPRLSLTINSYLNHRFPIRRLFSSFIFFRLMTITYLCQCSSFWKDIIIDQKSFCRMYSYENI